MKPVALGAPPTRRALFFAFSKVGLLGFGGVAALARHILVVECGLMSEQDFAESFGVSSTLPGANTVNLAAMLGDRWRGPPGAIAALFGLLGPQLGVLVCLLALYARFSSLADVRAGISGAAAAGLVITTSLQLFKALEPDLLKVLVLAGVGLAAAVLRVPMALILPIAVPVSLIVALSRMRMRT